VSGPFHDKENLDSVIFGRSVRVPKAVTEVETYLAKSVDVSATMSGSEVASKSANFGHICTDLQEIYVTLNFTIPVPSTPLLPPHANQYLGGSQSSPSNLELTIGNITILICVKSEVLNSTVQNLCGILLTCT
jgi:hypothetical protein